MNTLDENQAFLGRGWAFPPSFDIEKKSNEMVAGIEDINQSLEILLNTALGERVMQPQYGADLKNQVFEPMNAAVLTFIEDVIRTALIYHEPRILVNLISLVPDQPNGFLLISIEYTIRATNNRFNFVYPFFIAEGPTLG